MFTAEMMQSNKEKHCKNRHNLHINSFHLAFLSRQKNTFTLSEYLVILNLTSEKVEEAVDYIVDAAERLINGETTKENG